MAVTTLYIAHNGSNNIILYSLTVTVRVGLKNKIKCVII